MAGLEVEPAHPTSKFGNRRDPFSRACPNLASAVVRQGKYTPICKSSSICNPLLAMRTPLSQLRDAPLHFFVYKKEIFYQNWKKPIQCWHVPCKNCGQLTWPDDTGHWASASTAPVGVGVASRKLYKLPLGPPKRWKKKKKMKEEKISRKFFEKKFQENFSRKNFTSSFGESDMRLLMTRREPSL